MKFRIGYEARTNVFYLLDENYQIITSASMRELRDEMGFTLAEVIALIQEAHLVEVK